MVSVIRARTKARDISEAEARRDFTDLAAGMRTARTVVAINTDPKAPIHEEADYSIIGDLCEVIPTLVKVSEDARGRGR